MKSIIFDVLPKLKEGSLPHQKAQEKLAEHQTNIANIEQQLTDIESELENADQTKITKEEFLNLMKILPDKIRNGSVAEKDALARLLFLNCTIDAQNKATFLWKEPFSMLVNNHSVNTGGQRGT